MSSSSATPQHVTLRYFAWVREKTGVSCETVALPADIKTVGDLVSWLKTRGPEFETAFAAPTAVRAAIDKVHAKPAASLAGAHEIAFFPPVTGG